MKDDQTSVPPLRRKRDIVRNGIVMVSMTFVALAVGFGLHLQMGFAFWPAAAAGATVYVAMLFSHLMLSQNRETSMLHRELIRLNIELAELRRTPAEGGVLREAPGSGGPNSVPGSAQSYGYGRGYQPEVTVPLMSVTGPDSRSGSGQNAPNTQQNQIEMRARPAVPRDDVDARNAPVDASKRPAAKPRPSMDDAADLLSDLGSVADAVSVSTSAPAARPRMPVTPPLVTPVQPQPGKPVQVAVTAPTVADAMPAERSVAVPEPKPVAAKLTVPTEGDRDVEAIHDLIKKLAADIVGGQPDAKAVVMPPRSTMLVPERLPEKLVAKVAEPKPATVPPAPKHVASGRVPVAATKPTLPPEDHLAQVLADQLDTLPPVRGSDRPVAAAASPVAVAVAAARTAVEARMAVKASPLPATVVAAVAAVTSAPAPSETPVVVVLPVVAALEPEPEIDGDDLSAIGAQLAAGLGPERQDEPTLEINVQALKSAVDAMRAQPTVAALAAALDDTASHDGAPALVGDPALREKLELISNALDEDRFDVCLEAIIGLGDRRAQHYEVTVRLKDIDDDIRQIAGGSGLLPLLDATIVDQAARIAWKLEDRGKPGSLFSQITGESLESDRFLNRFADTYRHSETVASRLVLAFTQNDLRSFTAAHWATLRDMADLGFRFSLEELTDLDLDFETLRDAGFTFVKLDAAVFLDGLPIASGHVPAAQIAGYFEDLGLVVIVARIADEEQYEQLLDSGVGLGQGELFGIARPVKSDVLKPQQRAVA
jgi:cyclic-di-GMP phosphodiesterase, flagellum assembly factor TipF